MLGTSRHNRPTGTPLALQLLYVSKAQSCSKSVNPKSLRGVLQCAILSSQAFKIQCPCLAGTLGCQCGVGLRRRSSLQGCTASRAFRAPELTWPRICASCLALGCLKTSMQRCICYEIDGAACPCRCSCLQILVHPPRPMSLLRNWKVQSKLCKP